MSSAPFQLARELDVSLAAPSPESRRSTVVDTVSAGASLNVLVSTTCHLASTARLAMALSQAGATVSIIHPGNHPVSAVHAPVTHFGYSAVQPLASLQTAIERGRAELIIPCDERAVRDLHRLHATTQNRSTRMLIERSIGPDTSFNVATTRHDLLMVARQNGVAVPDSVQIDTVDDLRRLAADHPFPWVVKADGSWAGLGIRIVHSLEEAEAAYQQMDRSVALSLALREALVERDYFWFRPWAARQRPRISVQSFIAGRPANCAVACWRGEVLAGTAVEVVDAESATGPSTVVRVVEGDAMLDAARRVVAALELSGMVGFDFMVESATGRPYMIEMNPRNTPIVHVRLGPGRDLVEALLARAGGRIPRERPPVTDQETIVFFPHTWKHDPNSAHLHTGFHDVPWEEPALVRELVRPEMRERTWVMRTARQLWLSMRRRQRG